MEYTNYINELSNAWSTAKKEFTHTSHLDNSLNDTYRSLEKFRNAINNEIFGIIRDLEDNCPFDRKARIRLTKTVNMLNNLTTRLALMLDSIDRNKSIDYIVDILYVIHLGLRLDWSILRLYY